MMMNAYDIKIRSLAVLFSLLPSILLAAPSDEELAEARWFQVEVIVFEQLNKTYGKNEHWPELAGVKLPKGTSVLNPPLPPEPVLPEIASSLLLPEISPVETSPVPTAAPPVETTAPQEPAETTSPLPTPFQILDQQEMQLGNAYASLRRSQGFRPLLHVAWRQPTYEREEAQPVLIYDGIDEPAPVQSQPTPSEITDTLLGAGTAGTIALDQAVPSPEPEVLRFFPNRAQHPTEEDLKIGPPNPRFVGTLKLSVSRYLHLDTDLIFRRMTPQLEAIRVPDYVLWTDRPYPTLRQLQGPAFTADTWEAIRGFQLKESRRMRSTEVHYLDHPYFGLIVLVTPYELPTPAPEEYIPAPSQSIN